MARAYDSPRVSSGKKYSTQAEHKEFGIYVGTVVSAGDIARTGRLLVKVPGVKSSEPFTCRWTSPFAGVTSAWNVVGSETPETADYRNAQTSYGMWMVPPDPGNLVLVAFAEGNTNEPFVIACLTAERYNHMMPGMGSGKSLGNPSIPVAVSEKHRKTQPNVHDQAWRPVQLDLTDAVTAQGLILDEIRGIGSASARRESPSEVFGILTPGVLDPQAKGNNKFFRLAGHQLIMDDHMEHRMIRIRTGGGSQILLDDTTSSIYMINATGKCWAELDSQGNMNYYAENSINMRTGGDFNVRADGNVNIEAGQDMNLKAVGDQKRNNPEPSEYVGNMGYETQGTTQEPPGDGGTVNITASRHIHGVADRDIYLSATGGDFHEYAGNALDMQADGKDQTSGAAINLNAIVGGGIHMKSSTRITMGAQDIAGLAPLINFGGGLILLNSGAPVIPPAARIVKATRLLAQNQPDVTTQRPEFDAEAASSGQDAFPTQGKRPENIPDVATIVTVMPTPEPYHGHAKFTAQNVSSNTSYDPGPTEAAPPGSNPTPQGGNVVPANQVDGGETATVGVGYVNADGEQLASQEQIDQERTAGRPVNALYDVVSMNPAPTTGSGSREQFADTLAPHTNATAAAVPLNTKPTVAPDGTVVAGYQTKLDASQAATSQIVVDRQGRLISGDQATSVALSQQKESGALIPDNQTVAPAQSVTDSQGNTLFDFMDGMDHKLAAIMEIADLIREWDRIRTMFQNLALTSTQILAISDFSRDLGYDIFMNSNVARTLRQAAQTMDAEVRRQIMSEIPRQMQGWIQLPSGFSSNPIAQEALRQKRRYQAELLGMIPQAMPVYNRMVRELRPGQSNYGQLVSLLRTANQQVLRTKTVIGRVSKPI